MAEAWHALDVPKVYGRLGSSPAGLDSTEVRRRLERFGPNELERIRTISPLRIFLSQFLNVLVVVLLVAAFISGAIGILGGEVTELYDAVLILIIVFLNAIFGFVQEYRAERSLEALRALAAPIAHVVRGGASASVPSREVVPGDVLILSTGDKIPADGRLVETASLRVNEASLTGESAAVTKRTDPLPADTYVADRRNLAFAGTVVEAGRGRAVVVETGMRTELGKIAALVQQADEKTPLEKQLNRLGRQLGFVIVGVCAFVFTFGVLRDFGQVRVMFLTAVSLAVAAIPEGLPAVVTISLALGLQRMVRRHALIRRLPAVEALGSATVICSDKTGTLTKGEMNVRAIHTATGRYVVEGEGFDPRGRVARDGSAVDVATEPDLEAVLRTAVLCNDAKVRLEGDEYAVEGDATEIALLVAGMRAGLSKEASEAETPRVVELPFSSERKKMSTVHAALPPEQQEAVSSMAEADRAAFLERVGDATVHVKGAPERVLAGCDRVLVNGEVRPLDPEMRGEILYASQEMATRALRVLAMARKEVRGRVEPDEASLESGLVFLGLAGMMDAPRSDAVEAVHRAKGAGIQVVMITGDHRLTAMAVAREMDLLGEGDLAMTGEELDRTSDDDLTERVERVRVYARVSPEHKMRIVDAWRRRGHVVAMTGDGVNDAPALKRSDIGVSMGVTGTDVAKESSDMVLTDDNFASIVAAIEEGRGIYENIRKFVAYLLSANAGEVLIMFVATLMLADPRFLPFLEPIQLLWINLVTDGLPALALGVDPYPKDIMDRPPRDPRENVISRDVLFLIVLVGALLAAGTLGLFFLAMSWTNDVTLARTMAFTMIVFAELFIVFSLRSPRLNAWQRGLGMNRSLLLAVLISALLQIAVVQLGVFEPVFDTAALGPVEWALTLGFAFSIFVALEATKYVRRAFGRTPARAGS